MRVCTSRSSGGAQRNHRTRLSHLTAGLVVFFAGIGTWWGTPAQASNDAQKPQPHWRIDFTELNPNAKLPHRVTRIVAAGTITMGSVGDGTTLPLNNRTGYSWQELAERRPYRLRENHARSLPLEGISTPGHFDIILRPGDYGESYYPLIRQAGDLPISVWHHSSNGLSRTGHKGNAEAIGPLDQIIVGEGADALTMTVVRFLPSSGSIVLEYDRTGDQDILLRPNREGEVSEAVPFGDQRLIRLGDRNLIANLAIQKKRESDSVPPAADFFLHAYHPLGLRPGGASAGSELRFAAGQHMRLANGDIIYLIDPTLSEQQGWMDGARPLGQFSMVDDTSTSIPTNLWQNETEWR